MSDGPAPHDAARASRTGIVIVVLAVLIGVIVLAKGYGPARSEVTGSGSSRSTVATVATTTTLAGKPASEVKVKVVNATNTQGLAAKVRDVLAGRGYTQLTVGDAPTKQLQSDVFYLAGSEGEAQAVARALGINATNVRPMPEPPPVSPGEATVLVLAGTDLS